LKQNRKKGPRKTEPQDCKLLRVIVSGTKNGKKVTYEVETDLHHHPWGLLNGHFTVGFPAAITARMLGSGVIKEKGFFSSESIIDTDLYFKELAKRDIRVYARMTEEL
jgi:saccharopine dehydrogenase-like NADP-dependent oxidoreductase